MSWVNVAIVAGGMTTAVTASAAVAFAQIKHAIRRVVAEEVRDIADDLTALKMKLASEMGGNSNGLRQKLNEVSRDVADVSEDMAEVKGHLGMHR